MTKVAVLGAGSWGSALSIVLADNECDVRLWSHRKEQAIEINETRKNKQYLHTELPSNITAYSDLKAAVSDVDFILFVVPTKAIRMVSRQVNELLTHKPVVVHAAKGIEVDSLKRVSQIMSEELKTYSYEEIAVLSGPSHAEEVAERQPTTVTVASETEDHAKRAQDLFNNTFFRVYTSTDVIGTELGGALKNIIALGAGISDGLGYGDNAKAALITRGLAEISRLGTTLGANPLSFLGLSGVGDLIVTCTSKHSRNWRAGHMLGKGWKLQDVLDEMGMVVEGARTVKAAYKVAKDHKVDMPITFGIYKLLYGKGEAKEIAKGLMSRSKREEMDDLSKLLRERYS